MYNETRRAAHCGAQQARDESRAADSEDLNVTKQKIGILGAGTWGMALARMLCVSGNDVLVWSAIEKEIDALSSTRVHPNLPGMKIPEELRFTKSVEEVCRDKDILLFAVPSVFVRSTAAKARPYVAEGQIIVDVAKGIEPDTLYTMTEVLADELGREGGPKKVHLVALSGPTHAEEVAIDLPTTIVSASPDVEAAQFVQEVFSNSVMRVYTNEDIKGVELSGAMKNVIALGVGISTGLGYGDNARAALITRGIAEIARLGVAMGCNVHTFAGLAGIGDLIVTATSMHSRNNRAGILIGKGETPEQAVKEVGMVVEGMNALPAALELAERYGMDVETVTEETHLPFGNGELTIFPPLGVSGSNELGLTVLASAGEHDFLITGDMERATEKKLIETCELPELDVLMAGHHGSKNSTSKELLDAVTPGTVIISVGSNSYGHPAEDTLRRLARAGCDIYRTDRHGTVYLSFD